MSPEQALNNLASIANDALLNANDRNIINQSVMTLQRLIAETQTPKDDPTTAPDANANEPTDDAAATTTTSEPEA